MGGTKAGAREESRSWAPMLLLIQSAKMWLFLLPLKIMKNKRPGSPLALSESPQGPGLAVACARLLPWGCGDPLFLRRSVSVLCRPVSIGQVASVQRGPSVSTFLPPVPPPRQARAPSVR